MATVTQDAAPPHAPTAEGGAVNGDGADLARRELPAPYGTVTLLCVQVVAPARTAPTARATQGDGWADAVERITLIARRRVADHAGLCVRSGDDGLTAAFAVPGAAQRCAAAVQAAAARFRAVHPDAPVALRAGIHTGRVIRIGGDVYGVNVEVAAGIARAAGPGEVLVSALSRARTPTADAPGYGSARILQLGGVPDLYRVFPLAWRAPDTAAATATAIATARRVPIRLAS